MSSDSELEEFFDAEDVTPKRPAFTSRLESLDEIEREERELLRLQRQQEERRRKEDAELRARLKALKVKKVEKGEHKTEPDKKDLLDRRRRRHEELRKKMTEKGDYSDSCSQDDESDTTETEEEGFEGADNNADDDDGNGSDIENNMNSHDLITDDDVSSSAFEARMSRSRSNSPESSCVSGADTEVTGKYVDLSDNMSGNYPEKENSVTKHIQELVTDVDLPEKSRAGTIDHNMIDAEGIVANVLHESQLLSDSHSNEPDIVRSTKTRTPPNTLQAAAAMQWPKQPEEVSIVATSRSEVKVSEGSTFVEPVAPPRRKKKLQLDVNMEDPNSVVPPSVPSSPPQVSVDTPCDVSTPTSSTRSEPASPGLPPEHLLLGPEQEIDRLKADLEYQLDLRAVMKGRKHIRAEVAEKSAINTDQGSPRQTLESATTKSKSASLDRSSKMSSLDRNSSKTSSLDHDCYQSAEGKSSKSSSKGSSLERDGKKSKNTSLDRHSKSNSLEKSERRRSRNTSGADSLPRKTTGADSLPRKESVNRPRTGSSKPLTDEEILGAVMIKNLDTGEMVSLIEADQKLPKCVDPLVLHLLERTNELAGDENSDHDDDTRSESGRSISTDKRLRKKGAKLKKLFGKKVGKTVNKVKSVADQVMHGEENPTVVEGEVSDDGRKYKFKANHNKKGPYDFGGLKVVQDLSGEHTGAVWVMKFSPCGRLLATGGQDSVLRIWVLDSAFNYFDDMRQKYIEMKVSPAPSQESLSSIPSASDDLSSLDLGATAETDDDSKGPFKTRPFCKYRGHSADLLDVSWSKNYFILSSSMDKTVRLWHISRRECLCTFQHMDFVTAIVFHPRDDRYFLSGSLDGKLRLWNIPDKKVTLWNEVGNNSLITTANFCHNGKFAVVGTYDGKCIFYSTEHLKYYTQIHVRSTRGKNSRGRKITGIEPLPGEDKVLVTSNDSRVRLYDLRDLTLTCKYKGPTNTSSQIRANFSQKGKYIISGSEDHFIYMWRTSHEFYKFSSARRDRNDYYEAIKVHNAVVTAAVFAPSPQHFCASDETSSSSRKPKDWQRAASLQPVQVDADSEFVISADLLGCIKVIHAK